MVNYIKIGKQISKIRKQRKLTQAALAEIVDLSVQYISFLETGKKGVSLESLIKISEALEVSIDRLVCNNFEQNCVENEFHNLFSNCTLIEKNIIIDMAYDLKDKLLENRISEK